MSFTFHGHVEKDTDNAILFVCHDTGTQEWFPLSQVEEIHRDKEGKGHIIVTDWIAKQKGWDY